MGMYDNFGTDKSLEVNGVWTNYGDFQILIAHAGGANKSFLTAGEQKMKPFRRAIDSGTFPRERMEGILFELYSQHIVKGWQVNVGTDGEEQWQDGIEGPHGDIIPYNSENVLKTFRALPALFYDVKEVAESIAQFRQEELEGESKNS